MLVIILVAAIGSALVSRAYSPGRREFSICLVLCVLSASGALSSEEPDSSRTGRFILLYTYGGEELVMAPVLTAMPGSVGGVSSSTAEPLIEPLPADIADTSIVFTVWLLQMVCLGV